MGRNGDLPDAFTRPASAVHRQVPPSLAVLTNNTYCMFYIFPQSLPTAYGLDHKLICNGTSSRYSFVSMSND